MGSGISKAKPQKLAAEKHVWIHEFTLNSEKSSTLQTNVLAEHLTEEIPSLDENNDLVMVSECSKNLSLNLEPSKGSVLEEKTTHESESQELICPKVVSDHGDCEDQIREKKDLPQGDPLEKVDINALPKIKESPSEAAGEPKVSQYSRLQSFLAEYDVDFMKSRQAWKERKCKVAREIEETTSQHPFKPIEKVEEIDKILQNTGSRNIQRHLLAFRDFLAEMPNFIELCSDEAARNTLFHVCRKLSYHNIEYVRPLIGTILDHLLECDQAFHSEVNDEFKDKLVALSIELCDILIDVGRYEHLEALLCELSTHAVCLADLCEQRETTLEIQMRLCNVYKIIGKYALAQATAEVTLPLVESVHGNSSLKTAEILKILGEVCLQRRSVRRAEEYIKRALEICHALKGIEKEAIFITIVRLAGELYTVKNMFPDARQSLSIALDLAKSGFGRNSALYASVLFTWSEFYEKMDRLDKAQSTCSHALDIYLLIYGDFHSLDVARAYDRMAYLSYLRSHREMDLIAGTTLEKALEYIYHSMNIKLDLFGGNGEVLISFRRHSATAKKRGMHLQVHGTELALSKNIFGLICVSKSVRLKRSVKGGLADVSIEDAGTKKLLKKYQWKILRLAEKFFQEAQQVILLEYGKADLAYSRICCNMGLLHQTMREFSRAESDFCMALQVVFFLSQRENQKFPLSEKTTVENYLKEVNLNRTNGGTFIASSYLKPSSIRLRIFDIKKGNSFADEEKVKIMLGLPCEEASAISIFSSLGALYHYDLGRHEIALECIQRSMDMGLEIYGKYYTLLEYDLVTQFSICFALGEESKGNQYKEKYLRWKDEREKRINSAERFNGDDYEEDSKSIELTIESKDWL